MIYWFMTSIWPRLHWLFVKFIITYMVSFLGLVIQVTNNTLYLTLTIVILPCMSRQFSTQSMDNWTFSHKNWKIISNPAPPDSWPVYMLIMITYNWVLFIAALNYATVIYTGIYPVFEVSATMKHISCALSYFE